MYHPSLSQQQDFLDLLTSTNMYCGGTADLFDTTLLSPQEPSTRSPTPTSCVPLPAPAQQQLEQQQQQQQQHLASSTSAVPSASSYCWSMTGDNSCIVPPPANQKNELVMAGPPQPLHLPCSSTALTTSATVATAPSMANGLFADLEPDYINTADFEQGLLHIPTSYLPPPSSSSSTVPPPLPENSLPTDPQHLYQLNDIYHRHAMGAYYRPQAVPHHYPNSMATSAQTALTDVIGPSPAPLDYYYYHHHYRHPPQPPTPTRPPPPPPPATVHRKRRANDEDNSEAPEADSQPEFSAKRSKKLSTSGNHRRGTPIVFLEQHPHQQQPQPQPQQQDPPHHTLQQHPLFLQQQHLNDGFQANPSAVPRRQKLRYEGDEYTPKWVRFQGQLKEGYCDHCKPGKWLQLKNSAYWYHKQFFHGISSVSGKRFAKPLEQRASENDGIEGLCHQCRKFVPICNAKRKTSVLWYRHAHKCHVYDKPKPRLQTQVAKRNGKNQ